MFTYVCGQVTLGKHRRSSREGIEYKASEVIQHESYDQYGLSNDIGLVRLDREAEEKFQPICLGRPGSDPAPGERLLATGWGYSSTSPTRFPGGLQAVWLPLISRRECRRRNAGYHNTFDKTLCTWTKGKDTCTGDSGGPLMRLVKESTLE